MVCSLDRLKLGDEAEVQNVCSDNSMLRNRLLSMGLVSRTKLRVTNIAPLGDPISISFRGFRLSLRRSEAKSINVDLKDAKTHA